MVIRVETSGIALHICRRLLASLMLKTRIFLALIRFASSVRFLTLLSTVTKSSSYGSDLRHVDKVVSSSSPPVAIVGSIMVTSWEVYVGLGGIGIGV